VYECFRGFPHFVNSSTLHLYDIHICHQVDETKVHVQKRRLPLQHFLGAQRLMRIEAYDSRPSACQLSAG